MLPLTLPRHLHYQQLSQSSTQRQIPRARTDIHRLGIATNDPVLANRIPVRDISARDIVCENCGLSRIEDQVVETAEDDLWIGWASEGDVL
jgi:hypothetical protein